MSPLSCTGLCVLRWQLEITYGCTVCVGLPLFHCELFVVSRYYIRADSFPSLCFPLSSLSLSVVHVSARDKVRDIPTLSTPACCLSLYKDMCFLCVVVSPETSLQLQGVAEQTVCAAQDVHYDLSVLRWGGLLAWGRSCPLQDRQVCPLRCTIRTQRRERRQCWECLRKTKEHFRFQSCPETRLLHLYLDLSSLNISVL